jgi:hypothetical protein
VTRSARPCFPAFLTTLTLAVLAPACSGTGGDDDGGVRDGRVRDGQVDAAPSPDAATTCTNDDLIEQFLCGPGRKCTLVDASNHSGCSDSGSLEDYATCDTTNPADRPDDCGLGALCADPRGAAEFRCLPFCGQEGTYCAGGMCAFRVGLPGGEEVFLCAPVDGCNVLTQTGCGAGLSCYLAPIGQDQTFCLTAGTLSEGDACDGDFDCLPGLICFGPSDDRACRVVCDYGNGSGCGTEQSCMGIGSETYGLCW